MILIVCVDDDSGMMFAGRRQSQDRAVRERILDMAKTGRLTVTPYTAKQFGKTPLLISSDPAAQGEPGDFYFAEDGNIPEKGVEKIVVYRWNRRYPADRRFDLTRWRTRLVSTLEFPGFSHENITEEIYEVLS